MVTRQFIRLPVTDLTVRIYRLRQSFCGSRIFRKEPKRSKRAQFPGVGKLYVIVYVRKDKVEYIHRTR